MVQRVASFRNRRYSTYVPAMGYAADVLHGAAYEVDFLTPIACCLDWHSECSRGHKWRCNDDVRH